MVSQLAIVSDLEATYQASRAVRKEDALQRKRIGARSQARVAIAEMAADIKSGPVVDVQAYGRLRSLGDIGGRRLDRQVRRQIGCHRNRTCCEPRRATPEFADPLHHAPSPQASLDHKTMAFIPESPSL